LTVPGSDFAFGTGDFTIEAWVYLPVAPSGSYAAIVDIRNAPQSDGSILWGLNSSRVLVYYGYASTTNSVPLNQWSHVAICRSSGVTRMFIDGTQGSSSTESDNKTGVPSVFIGRVYDNFNPAFQGYIEDFRVNPFATYSADFTPPTSALGSDPSPAKPVMQAITTDLTDRLPYGIPNTPIVNNINPWEFKGRGRITGTVKNTPNTPVFRLVRLYREPGGMLVKSVWSDPTTGEYIFDGIPTQFRYTVLGYDYTETYRAVVADRVIPDLIP